MFFFYAIIIKNAWLNKVNVVWLFCFEFSRENLIKIQNMIHQDVCIRREKLYAYN